MLVEIPLDVDATFEPSPADLADAAELLGDRGEPTPLAVLLDRLGDAVYRHGLYPLNRFSTDGLATFAAAASEYDRRADR